MQQPVVQRGYEKVMKNKDIDVSAGSKPGIIRMYYCSSDRILPDLCFLNEASLGLKFV